MTGIAVGGGDSSLVISSSADGQVRIWDLRFNFNVPCRVLKGHSNRVSSLYWDGHSDFHTASHDGRITFLLFFCSLIDLNYFFSILFTN